MKNAPNTKSSLHPKARAALFKAVACALAITVTGFIFLHAPITRADEQPRVVSPPALDESAGHTGMEIAVLSGGCFWGVQGVYQHVDGVLDAVSGYTGGSKANASYDLVSSGKTGHAESVQISYDPRRISYGALLQIFFSVVHDPTELDRQGPDEGSQYRSAIFPQNAEQARIASAYVAQLNGAQTFAAPIVTVIEPGRTFYSAEGYHQNYLVNHPNTPYIFINDLPKVAALRRLFPQRWHGAPALVAQASPSQ
ncbi:MAG TPA: peptide-methionine (S)-S-oxide reductase MsrA [Steroidobacteraceae bacterium]|nr:peptide-methionine (S)-S-oxide reductase MsrA [Steroidobacteraceae bacterium]